MLLPLYNTFTLVCSKPIRLNDPVKTPSDDVSCLLKSHQWFPKSLTVKSWNSYNGHSARHSLWPLPSTQPPFNLWSQVFCLLELMLPQPHVSLFPQHTEHVPVSQPLALLLPFPVLECSSCHGHVSSRKLGSFEAFIPGEFATPRTGLGTLSDL